MLFSSKWPCRLCLAGVEHTFKITTTIIKNLVEVSHHWLSRSNEFWLSELFRLAVGCRLTRQLSSEVAESCLSDSQPSRERKKSALHCYRSINYILDHLLSLKMTFHNYWICLRHNLSDSATPVENLKPLLFLISQLELNKYFGWEVIRFQETQASPDALSRLNIMPWITENHHKGIHFSR